MLKTSELHTIHVHVQCTVNVANMTERPLKAPPALMNAKAFASNLFSKFSVRYDAIIMQDSSEELQQVYDKMLPSPTYMSYRDFSMILSL